MKFKPLGNRILIKFIEEEKKVNGLIIPNSTPKKDRAKVIAVGDGTEDKVMILSEGDIVYVDKYCGQDITIDEQDYKVVLVDNVLGIEI